MSRSLGTLTLDLVARTGGFVQGMTKSQRTTQKWRRQVERDLNRVAKSMAAVGVAAAGTLVAVTRTGMTFIDSQAKTAERLDATIDGLRAAQIVASDFGVEAGTLTGAMERLNRELAGALDGEGNAATALGRLGLDARTLMGMDVDQRLEAIAQRVQALGLNSAETADLLRDLGIRNQSMINILQGGAEAFGNARQEVEDYGLSLSKVDAARVEAANDKLARIPMIMEGIRNQVVMAALPAIEDLVETLSDPATIESAKAIGESIVNSMTLAIEAIRETVGFVQWIGQEMGVVAAGIRGLELEEQLHRINNALENPSQRLRFFGPDGLVAYYSRDELLQARDEILQQLAMDRPAVSIDGPDASGGANPQQARTMMEMFLGAGLEAADHGLARVGDAAKHAAKALEDFNPAMNDEVRDILDRAGPGATIDTQGMIRDAWGNALPSLQRELEAELQRQADEFQSEQNLLAGLEAAAQTFVDGAVEAATAAWSSIQPASAEQVADGVLPTAEQGETPIRWSTDLGGSTPGTSPAASPAAAASAASGIDSSPAEEDQPLQIVDFVDQIAHLLTEMRPDVATIAEKVTSVAESMGAGGGGEAGSSGPNLGTLRLSSEGGEVDVQGNADQLTKWLADTLGGVAAGSS